MLQLNKLYYNIIYTYYIRVCIYIIFQSLPFDNNIIFIISTNLFRFDKRWRNALSDYKNYIYEYYNLFFVHIIKIIITNIRNSYKKGTKKKINIEIRFSTSIYKKTNKKNKCTVII